MPLPFFNSKLKISFIFIIDEAADPGLATFSKMVKCLSAQGRGGSLGLSGPEWNQFNTNPGMQFVPNWNYGQNNQNNNNQNNNNNQQQQPGWRQPQPGSPGAPSGDWGSRNRPGGQQVR